MGEAKNRVEEIEEKKAAMAQQQFQLQQMAQFTQKEATFVNGVYVCVVDVGARVSFHENVHQMLPCTVRGSYLMSMKSLKDIGRMFMHTAFVVENPGAEIPEYLKNEQVTETKGADLAPVKTSEVN